MGEASKKKTYLVFANSKTAIDDIVKGVRHIGGEFEIKYPNNLSDVENYLAGVAPADKANTVLVTGSFYQPNMASGIRRDDYAELVLRTAQQFRIPGMLMLPVSHGNPPGEGYVTSGSPIQGASNAAIYSYKEFDPKVFAEKVEEAVTQSTHRPRNVFSRSENQPSVSTRTP